MAKKPNKETSLSLSKMIPAYGRIKAQMSEDKKAADKLNERIKSSMREEAITEKEVDGYIASYAVRVSESYNEDTLIDVIKKHDNLKSCLKKKLYVDMEELEKLIYNNKIPKKVLLEMDKCRIKKETEVLTVTKVKEKKV